jgi:predicted Zn-dependent peptidase
MVRVKVSLPWAGIDAPLVDQLSAAMMGQMLKAGTLHRSGAALAADLDRLGARWGVGVTSSRLWGDVEVPLGGEAEALALLSEVLLQPAMDRSEAKRIIARWITWREGLGLDLVRSHNRAVNHAWFPSGHPSRHTSTVRDLKRLSAKAVADLHRRIVAGALPRIAVVGDTTAELILPLLEQGFGHLAGTTTPGIAPTLPPRSTSWLVDRPGFEVVRLTMVLPGPSVEDPDAALADLLMALLASEFTSRIPMDLRETRGLAYSVSGSARSWRGDGRLRIDAEVDIDRAAEALVALEDQLDRLLTEGAKGISAAELRAARNTLIVRAGRQLETLGSATDTLAELDILERTLADLRAEQATIATATANDLVRVAEKWLPKQVRIWIMTGDRMRLEPMLETADRVPDRIVSAAVVSSER